MMRRLSAILLGTAVLAVLVWTLAAFGYRIPSPVAKGLAMAGAVLTAIAILLLSRRALRLGWVAWGAALLAAMGWWSTIQPRQDRDWAPEYARSFTAEIGATDVTLHNIRDFAWQTPTEATPRWISQTYPLDGITSVDLVTSVWNSPAIAHVLVSFGFADGRHLVFSAETRRERHEVYSTFGGFFKSFELALIAATETDIVKLRTNVRGEDVSLFPLRVTPEQARSLFLSYLERGNQLARKPEFYHTVTANCTTVIFGLTRSLRLGIPLDWRILASGYLPDYLYGLHALKTQAPLAEVLEKARITARARSLAPEADYSAGIRQP